MDVQTGLVCVVLVIISGAILMFISMFGMREKTYEEAIAEQRKMPNDALLLGRPNKDKNKDKKQKRQGKKVKEKPSGIKVKEPVKSQSSTETDSEVVQKESEHIHVNFVSPEAEVLKKGNPGNQPDKKKKKEKIKPILVNKEEPVIVKDKPSHKDVTVNHFTQIIPKDDLQLKLATNKTNHNLNNSQPVQANSTDTNSEKDRGKEKQIFKQASKENNKIENEKINKIDVKVVSHKVQKNEKVKNEQQQQPPPQQQQLQQQQILPQAVHQVKMEMNGSISNSSVEQSPVQQQKINNQQLNNKEQKNKKHKKNEVFSLQHMADKDGVNIQLLIPLIRKAELSRTEVQILTDILLTKHFDEVSDHFEWIEGRQDPTVKLKKQLAEKEKALAEEQEASQAFQNKLKELRSEYNAERARLTQACRQYDETVLAKQQELQNLHATNRHMMEKIQQLQAQVNDDKMVIRKLQEDHSQTQNALQQELVQRQQLEMHIARLQENQAQKNVEAQIHAKIQEAEQLRASFNTELQKNRRYEEELRELREQHVQNQNKIKSLESRASQLKESSNHTQELARQIEELQRGNIELEKRLTTSLQSEEELKFEKSKLQNDIHAFTNKVSELQRDCEKLMQERDDLSAQVANKAQVSDLTREIMKFKEENQSLISQVSSFTKLEREAQQLREENESLAAQVTAFTERPAADGRENGDSPYCEERKTIHVEFINQENNPKQKDLMIDKLAHDLKEKEMLVEKLSSELNGCQSEISRLSSEVAKYKTEVPKLREELEAQRNKNNDLRQKNWKAMEALSATEKSLENKVKETEKLTQDRLRQEQAIKNSLERIFPNIQVEEKVFEDWLFKFEKKAKEHLDEMITAIRNSSSAAPLNDASVAEELESKNSQLQSLVVHYKTIIEDTEGMLNKLQTHVEQEEIRWRQQYEVLEQEIQAQKDSQAIVENLNAELKSKVQDLEEKLAETKALNSDSVRQESNELRRLIDKQTEKCNRLAEENDSLNAKLAAEQDKNMEINKELVKLKSTVKMGQDAYVEENHKRLELEEELKLLKSKSNIRDSQVNSTADFMASEMGGFDGN